MLTTQCKTCGQAIRWVVMQRSGKRMPLDLEPTADGTVEVDDMGNAAVLGGLELEGARLAGVHLYRSHAAGWRKKS